MLKILAILFILSACSPQDSGSQALVSENLEDKATGQTESENEATEQPWTKEEAEGNKDKDITSLLASENSAPYYIEGEITENKNFISNGKTKLYLENTHNYDKGDIVKLWGNIKSERIEDEGTNIYYFEILDSEVVEKFTGVYLSEGSHIIGEDIAEGRYEITGSNLGSIKIYDEYNEVCDEILGGDGIEGVSKLYINLVNDYTIDIKDIKAVKFTPDKDRKAMNTLYTGFWEAGTDIEAGEYKIKSVTGQAGKIFILDMYGETKLDHGLGQTSESPEPIIQLEEGDIIWIQKMDSVKFESTSKTPE